MIERIQQKSNEEQSIPSQSSIPPNKKVAPSPEKAKLLIDVKIEGFKVGKKGTYAILDKNNEGDCSVKGVMALKYQSPCDYQEASHFLTFNHDHTYILNKKELIKPKSSEKDCIGFLNRHMKYYYCEKLKGFITLDYNFFNKTNKEILQQKPLNQQEIQFRQNLFGKCQIDFPIMNYLQFMALYLTQPQMIMFFVAILTWYLQGYIFFALVTILTTIILSFILHRVSRTSKLNILNKVKVDLPVLRFLDQNFKQVQSSSLVPGDFILVQPNTNLPCDIILVSGEAFVNESNITGEADPIPKLSLVNINQVFNFESNATNVIYEGSKIINSSNQEQSNQFSNKQNWAVGLVLRTSYSTKKGQVIRYSIFPKPIYQQFYTGLTIYCGICLFFVLIAFFVQLPFLYDDDNIPRNQIWLKFGEAFIMFLPPTIILINLIALIIAQIRLKSNKIESGFPDQIPNCGLADTICFDKTGTLTQNVINPFGFWTENLKFVGQNQSFQTIQNKNQNDTHTQHLFATCHAVQQNQLNQEEILGDQVDVSMFKLSGFKISQKNQTIGNIQAIQTMTLEQETLNILKRFEFQPTQQCMSTIVQNSQQLQFLYTKGSPEKIKKICKPNTIPSDYENIYEQYTIQGYRLLGLAYKDFQISESTYQDLDRSQVEQDLNFLGFLVLENPLKEDSQEVFQRLQNADLSCKIVSGDNHLTVTQCGFELGLIDKNIEVYHFLVDDSQEPQVFKIQKQKDSKIQTIFENNNQSQVLQELYKFIQDTKAPQLSFTGKTLAYLTEQYQQQNNNQEIQAKWNNIIKFLIIRGQICSRLNPKQKQQIIAFLKSEKIQTIMIGDGANDCLAIQEANIGISFSSAEAALSSHFATNIDSIQCVEKIILEGRNIQETNYEVSHTYFQQSTMRVAIQSILIMDYMIIGSFQTFFQAYVSGYLLWFIVAPLSKPLQKIEKERLQTSMISKRSFVGCLGRWAMLYILIFSVNANLRERDFYQEPPSEYEEEDVLNMEGQPGTVLFFIIAIVTSFAPIMNYVSGPIKQQIYKNYLLIFFIFIHLAVNVLAMFADESTISSLKLVELPSSYRLELFIYIVLTLIATTVWEKIVVKKIAYFEKNNVQQILNRLQMTFLK